MGSWDHQNDWICFIFVNYNETWISYTKHSVAGQLPKFRYGNKSSHLRKKEKKFLLDSLRSFKFLWCLYHLPIRITGVSRSQKTAERIDDFFENFQNFFINYRISSKIIDQKNKIVENWGITLPPFETFLTHRILECVLTLVLLLVSFFGCANCPLVARQWKHLREKQNIYSRCYGLFSFLFKTERKERKKKGEYYSK